MANTHESGHAINVANFNKILSDLNSYGDLYKPSNENLKVNALNTLLTNSTNALHKVAAAEAAYKLAISARKVEFRKLSPQLTRVNNIVKANETSPMVLSTVQSLVRKMQGRRASPKKSDEEKKLAADAGKEIVEISTSQMSYDSRLENFRKLIFLVSTLEHFAPNEAELKVPALELFLSRLIDRNNEVITANITLRNARITRNDVLYKPDSGLFDIVLSSKAYVRALFGVKSPQYKKISGVKFTKPR